jgi:hypothetical protein
MNEHRPTCNPLGVRPVPASLSLAAAILGDRGISEPDRATGAAATGAGTGASIGLLGGPFGIAAGALLGAGVGAGIGVAVAGREKP